MTQTMKLKRTFLIPAFAVFTLTLGGCLPTEEPPLDPPVLHEYEAVTPRTAAAAVGELTTSVNISLTRRPVREERYAFTAAGFFVDAVNVKIGDIVAEGDLLATLDASDIELKLLDAKSDVRQAELEFERVKGMTNNTTVRRLELARLKRDTLQAQLDERGIVAVASGVVTFVKKCGSDTKSAANEVIITVSDVSEVVYVASGANAAHLQDGETYRLTLNGETFVAPAITEYGGMFSFKPEGLTAADDDTETVSGDYAENAVTDLPMYGSITLELERRDAALYVPARAVKQTNNGWCVYTLNDAGLREPITVTVGLQIDGKAEILSGLKEGDEVVVD
jgi:multidrug efflux pump subunit AcrA (membrane-fusion protein)